MTRCYQKIKNNYTEGQIMEENKKARVIAIGIQKGGTGKTQTSVNLASGLVRKGRKCW